MSNVNPDSPAFPAEWVAPDTDCGQSKMHYAPGMTVRTWLAGKAMNGLLSNVGHLTAMAQTLPGDPVKSAEVTAKHALLYADALIAELNK